LPPQLWNLIRQRDATREAAVRLYQCGGERVSRDLLPTAPPPVAACGEVRMTREERMRALGCMGRTMVMLKLARGAGMPGALVDADAQEAEQQQTAASLPLCAWPRAMAVMMKRDAAARAPPFHPCHPFAFSSCAEHKAPDVVLSPDRLTVTQTTRYAYAWARSELGVAAGCGVVRWAVQLGKESGGLVSMVGVASDAFSGYTEAYPKQSWFFQDDGIWADGQQQGGYFDPKPFGPGDVVTVELERAPGVDGVLRVRVAGKTPREWRGLPRDGMLYPIVCMCHQYQSYTMVALP